MVRNEPPKEALEQPPKLGSPTPPIQTPAGGATRVTTMPPIQHPLLLLYFIAAELIQHAPLTKGGQEWM
jgi:hypothetical protein